MPPIAPTDPSEILVSLALLGEATRADLAAIHALTLDVTKRRLQALSQAGMITERRRRSLRPNRPPTPLPSAYSLTDLGREAVRHDPRYPTRERGQYMYPAKSPADNRATLEHDLLGSTAVASLVAMARLNGFGGMFLRSEWRLDPDAPAPRIDQVLIVHASTSPLADGAAHWTRDMPPADVARFVFGIEADRNTESLDVIRGKARAYRQAYQMQRTHDYWQPLGGAPMVIWVAPTERRLLAIHEAWAETWPQGRWMLATVEMLTTGRAYYYLRGGLLLITPLTAGDESIGHQLDVVRPAPQLLAPSQPAEEGAAVLAAKVAAEEAQRRQRAEAAAAQREEARRIAVERQASIERQAEEQRRQAAAAQAEQERKAEEQRYFAAIREQARQQAAAEQAERERIAAERAARLIRAAWAVLWAAAGGVLLATAALVGLHAALTVVAAAAVATAVIGLSVGLIALCHMPGDVGHYARQGLAWALFAAAIAGTLWYLAVSIGDALGAFRALINPQE